MHSRRRQLLVAFAVVGVLAGCSAAGDPAETGGPEETPVGEEAVGEAVADLVADILDAGGSRYTRVDGVEELGSEEALRTRTVGVIDRVGSLATAETTWIATSEAIAEELLADPSYVDLELDSVIETTGGKPTTYVTLSGTPDVSAWDGSWWRVDGPISPTVLPELQVADPAAMVARVCALAQLDPVGFNDTTQAIEVEGTAPAAVALLPNDLTVRLAEQGIGPDRFDVVSPATVRIVNGGLHVELVVTELIAEVGAALQDPAVSARAVGSDVVFVFDVSASPGGETVELPPDDEVVTAPPARG